jgi:hypothetical protein
MRERKKERKERESIETFVVESRKQAPLLKPVQPDITDKSCISISPLPL